MKDEMEDRKDSMLKRELKATTSDTRLQRPETNPIRTADGDGSKGSGALSVSSDVS